MMGLECHCGSRGFRRELWGLVGLGWLLVAGISSHRAFLLASFCVVLLLLVMFAVVCLGIVRAFPS